MLRSFSRDSDLIFDHGVQLTAQMHTDLDIGLPFGGERRQAKMELSSVICSKLKKFLMKHNWISGTNSIWVVGYQIIQGKGL